MKVQKRFLRKYKDKDYYKYIVNIPPMVLKEAGFKDEDYLDIKVEKGKIILKKKVKEENLK